MQNIFLSQVEQLDIKQPIIQCEVRSHCMYTRGFKCSILEQDWLPDHLSQILFVCPSLEI